MDQMYFSSKWTEIERDQEWNKIFMKIRDKSGRYEDDHKFSTSISNLEQNIEKNRYLDVRPFDHCRVTLGDDAEHDYINASPVEVPEVKRSYILAQGPLATTSADFWQMVFAKNTKLIIMLNNIVEQYMVKCHRYFPCQDEPAIYAIDPSSDRRFRCKLVSESDQGDFIIREIELDLLTSGEHEDDGSGDEEDVVLEKRTITHYQYTTWPDFGCPRETGHFLAFREHLKSSGKLESDSTSGPVVIHCSAGIGRTGTFVVIDTVLASVEYGSKLDAKSLEEWILYLRRFRRGLIQTAQQLRFSWQSIVEGLEDHEDASNDSKKENSEALAEGSNEHSAAGDAVSSSNSKKRPASNAEDAGKEHEELQNKSSDNNEKKRSKPCE
ncbi:hypothetical protein L596_007300 [Steinernema carpocapsae]|uniref:protein-tyrosine-phosphatase n=1 Tax=Steinernema carpocapsae TaxID=34508 RepID=A0A4U5P8T9_STECR|nr:hypothetical protein L596_007300 [Steinernema carpocapsae]